MRLALLLLVWAVPGGAFQAPPARFALEIPGYPEQTFQGEIIELPAAHLDQVVIHILEPLASRVSYSRIFPRVNLQAAAVISQVRTSARGKSVVLNLRMRPDITFGPGVNSLEIAAMDMNGRRYYRNWIIRLSDEARNDWFAYEFTRGAGDGAPPEIEIREPDGPVPLPHSGSAKVRVRGLARGLSPLRSLLVSGQAQRLPAEAEQAEFDVEVPVSQGLRSLIVEASDVAGHRTRVTIPVGGDLGDLPPAATADRMAIVIGISRYQNESSALCAPGAQAAQAEGIVQTLVRTGGFSSERIFLLRDREATLQQIRNAIRNAAAAARPDDLLLVYFGGCGLQDPLQPERFFLAAFDTQPGALADTAFDLAELEQLLNSQVRSRNVLLAFETAASPRIQDSLGGANLIGMRLLQLASAEKGRSVLVSPPAAAAGGQSTAASSLFAEALHEALRGRADANGDRLITTTELVRFVARRMRQAGPASSVMSHTGTPAVLVTLTAR